MQIKLLYKLFNFDNYCVEVFMKAKWKNEEILDLYSLIEQNNKKHLSTMHSFRQFANKTNRNPLSVRNFYYTNTKILKQNNTLAKNIGIDLSKHTVQTFNHFDKEQESKLLEQYNKLISQGLTCRSACMQLSNGDIKQMLRIQNKIRSIKNFEKQKNVVTNYNNATNKQYIEDEEIRVLKFPAKSQSQKSKLTEDEIKSLFMGLVKLVKENANADEHEKAEKYLKQVEEEKRKHIIELENKQDEIDKLKEEMGKLKIKKDTLSKQIENYRINYLSENLTNTLPTI